jgi:hypothetical protein
MEYLDFFPILEISIGVILQGANLSQPTFLSLIVAFEDKAKIRQSLVLLGLVGSCLVLSGLVWSGLVLSYLFLSGLVVWSCLVLSFGVFCWIELSCVALSFCLVFVFVFVFAFAVSCGVLSYRVLSYVVVSCLVLSCLILSCLVFFVFLSITAFVLVAQSCLDSVVPTNVYGPYDNYNIEVRAS